jgi:hypothetical protein
VPSLLPRSTPSWTALICTTCRANVRRGRESRSGPGGWRTVWTGDIPGGRNGRAGRSIVSFPRTQFRNRRQGSRSASSGELGIRDYAWTTFSDVRRVRHRTHLQLTAVKRLDEWSVGPCEGRSGSSRSGCILTCCAKLRGDRQGEARHHAREDADRDVHRRHLPNDRNAGRPASRRSKYVHPGICAPNR